jgi:hypothetical protein
VQQHFANNPATVLEKGRVVQNLTWYSFLGKNTDFFVDLIAAILK